MFMDYLCKHPEALFSANIKPVFKGIVVLAYTLQLYQPVWDLLENALQFLF